MRKILSGAVLVLVLFSAACASGDDDDVLGKSSDKSSDTKDKNTDNKDNGDGNHSAEEQAYIDAIAANAQTSDSGEDSSLALSGHAAKCYGEAWVDVVGVDTLKGKVTPEEIRDNPEKKASDFGLEVSKSQGRDIFRQLLDCEPDVMKQLAKGIAGSMGSDDFPLDVDVDCLARANPDDIEDFMGTAIAEGDKAKPTRDEATALMDWLGGCTDLKSAIIDGLAKDPQFPSGAKACLQSKLDENVVKEFMVESAMADGDRSAILSSPAGRAFTQAVTTCATGGIGN